LDLIYEYTSGEETKASWIESLTVILENLQNKDRWGLGDERNHNVSGIYISGLESQKHCYLLHQLYDDFHLSWEEILALEWMWLDFELRAQFEFRLNNKNNFTETEKLLIKIEEYILEKIEMFQRKARRRVLSKESYLCDYELILVPSFCKTKKENFSCFTWETNIKHRNPLKWFGRFLPQKRSRFLQELELQLEEMGVERSEEMLSSFDQLFVDLILKYQYRLPLKGVYGGENSKDYNNRK